MFAFLSLHFLTYTNCIANNKKQSFFFLPQIKVPMSVLTTDFQKCWAFISSHSLMSLWPNTLEKLSYLFQCLNMGVESWLYIHILSGHVHISLLLTTVGKQTTPTQFYCMWKQLEVPTSQASRQFRWLTEVLSTYLRSTALRPTFSYLHCLISGFEYMREQANRAWCSVVILGSSRRQ